MKRLILTVLAVGAVGAAAAQECGEPMTLQRCLELGLEQNYDVRIIRNEQRISDNDATAANAGMLPSVDLTAGYSGALDNERTTPREGDAVTENGIYDQTFDAGVAVNWTLFDGFRIRTNYKRLQELQQMGALRTRITIEDFVATLTAEYYNYVQQTLRLSNFRYAVQLSRERLRITEERFKIGSFSRLDLLQARVDFNADSSKVVFLVLWIVSLFTISAYLIYVEYMDYTLQERLTELGIKEDGKIDTLLPNSSIDSRLAEMERKIAADRAILAKYFGESGIMPDEALLEEKEEETDEEKDSDGSSEEKISGNRDGKKKEKKKDRKKDKED